MANGGKSPLIGTRITGEEGQDSAAARASPPAAGKSYHHKLDESNAITLVRTVPTLSDLRSRFQQNDINSPLPNEDWNALTYFVAENDVGNVSKLILSGAQTDHCGSARALTGTGHTPLHVAARYGSVECMEHLIRGRVRRSRKDFGSDMEVQMEAELTMINRGENIGCDVNSRDNFGFAPIHYAACSGYVDGVDALLRLGADVMSKGGKTGKVTARGIAEQRGHQDIADLLSRWERKLEDPINAKFREWLAALDCEMHCQAFIDAGYDLQFIKKNGITDDDLDCVGVPQTKLGLRRKLMSQWKIDNFMEGGEDEEEQADNGVEDGDGDDSGSSGSDSGSGSDSESGSGSGSGSGSESGSDGEDDSGSEDDDVSDDDVSDEE